MNVTRKVHKDMTIWSMEYAEDSEDVQKRSYEQKRRTAIKEEKETLINFGNF